MNERIERERVCRSITYKITADDAEQKVSSFLKHKGYSTQNRVNLKKDPKSIWVNGMRFSKCDPSGGGCARGADP